MKSLSRTLIATAVLGLGLAAGTTSYAATFEDFTVDESSVPGNTGTTLFTADKLNGGYSERITFDGAGGFVTNAYADFGQFFANEGTTLVTTSVLNTQYGMYAVFESTGTVGPCGPLTCFNGLTGEFHLFIDPNQDTTKALGATGSDPIALGGTGDDYEIAFATVLSTAVGVLGPTGGFFDLFFEDFTLTVPGGTSFFISPDPFYIRVNVDGDFDNFTVAGTQTVTGDVSAVFLPEPALPALLGMVGLIGFGFARRKLG